MGEYDFTLNPYSGCSFGCTYCYAAFFSRDAEKRDSWGYWVDVKENAVELMAKRRAGSLDGKLIYMSSVTDPYQPVEREIKLTRGILEIMAERHRPKLVVQTRSPDVVRDCDLFRKIEENGGRVQVNMTVTTDDEDIRRTFEPFCPSNMVRLQAIGEVQREGIDTCITMTPLLMVSSPYAFADSLIDTGVQKFIAQPFHFQRGKFLAGTRDKAFDLMAEKLGNYILDYPRLDYSLRHRASRVPGTTTIPVENFRVVDFTPALHTTIRAGFVNLWSRCLRAHEHLGDFLCRRVNPGWQGPSWPPTFFSLAWHS